MINTQPIQPKFGIPGMTKAEREKTGLPGLTMSQWMAQTSIPEDEAFSPDEKLSTPEPTEILRNKVWQSLKNWFKGSN